MKENSFSTTIAFFHNQRDPDPSNSLYNIFNTKYAFTSSEIGQEYHPKSIETAFGPVIQTIKNCYPNLNSVKILEIGGASGLFSRYLQDQGSQVTMIDTQEIFVDQAKKRGVNAFLSTGSALPSAIQDKFDLIVANRVFEDIVMPEYQATSLLRKITPILEPKGLIIIGSNNPSAIWNYSFLKNGLQLKSSQFNPGNNYIKEARVYQPQ